MWGLVLVQMIEVRSDADLRTTPEPSMQHFPFGLVYPPGRRLGFRVWGSESKVEGSDFRGAGFRLQR